MSRVLLTGWDAADWKVIRPLMAAGKMPNLRRLVESGASGPVATLYPPLSPMLWTSIATGKRPFKHGILGFSEPSPDGRRVRPVTNLSRSSKAVWNILNQNGLRSIVVGWWPSHPAEPVRGAMVSDHFHRATGPLKNRWPIPKNSVHPPELAQAIAKLRVHPDSIRPADVLPFIPRAREIDQVKDKRLALFLRTLAECMSIQAASLWLMEHCEWDFAAVYFDSIDHFSHGFMRFHPPRQAWVGERDFEMYRGVVARAYQFHDRLLGELIRKAGRGARVIVVSDHGFHPDHLRPSSIPKFPAGPAIEHRDFGVLALRGPGIRKAAQLRGASVLDLAPTILAMFGLPAAEDMDGKVLSHAFIHAPNTGSIDSWDKIEGEDGRHAKHSATDPLADHAMAGQLAALGYIEPPDDDASLEVAKTVRELRLNLGEAYQDAGRHGEARDIFRELYRADPKEERFALRLFVSAQALGSIGEMRRIVDALPGEGNPALRDYLRAQILIAEGRLQPALQLLERVAESRMVRPGVFLETADLYVRLGRSKEARGVYEKALGIDADNVAAYLGLSGIALRGRKYREAAQFALEALDRTGQEPRAHFLLGRALEGLKQNARAAASYREALALNPNYPDAHARLAKLETRSGDARAAREHRSLARRMRSGRL